MPDKPNADKPSTEMPVLQGPPNRMCYKHTCAIQACLSENNFDARKCAWAVENLKRCCKLAQARDSVHCAFPDARPSNG